jgi:hypothetical protein
VLLVSIFGSVLIFCLASAFYYWHWKAKSKRELSAEEQLATGEAGVTDAGDPGEPAGY